MRFQYLVVIIVLVLGLAFFLLKDQILNTTPTTSVQPTQQTSVNTTTTPIPPEATSITAEPEEITVVTLTSSGFSPASLTVKAGTKITFANKSGKAATVDSNPHPLHTTFPALNLGAFKDGGTHIFTFDNPGTYGYHNHLNAIQKGTIVVQ